VMHCSVGLMYTVKSDSVVWSVNIDELQCRVDKLCKLMNCSVKMMN
jgi:hypothetical protein